MAPGENETQVPWAPRSFWQLAGAQFGVLSAALTAAAAIFAVVSVFVAFFQKASVVFTVDTIILAFLIPSSLVAPLCAMVRAAITDGAKAAQQAELILPKALRWLENSIAEGRPLLLVGPSRLLGQGLAVSIYRLEDDHERLLGQGLVQVVQQNMKIQIAIINFEPGTDNLWSSIRANSPEALARTLVRPGHQMEWN